MRPCPNQLQNKSISYNLVNQQPVRLDMALPHPLILSRIDKRMIPISLRQRLFIAQKYNHLFQFLRITAPFDRQLIISLKLPRKLRPKSLFKIF